MTRLELLAVTVAIGAFAAAVSCKPPRVATIRERTTMCGRSADRYCERFNPKTLYWERAPSGAVLWPSEWRGSCQPIECPTP